ncbi:hypothetical protein JKL49_05810 [Phenylobacterium sp. 20VBR1]|uniref:Uncharacterized protein n=1 Tax=Phenylobacterium glaciei TaxID=2803784 RepID=A0A941CZW2_9CAUL|nr:hypothetical protein [Phenylobacterium glaciei]MBR7618899.1 hypothetical protein [Phenylobacterium glaciei]
MAAVSDGSPAPAGRDEGFFLRGAGAMALVIVAGFSVQLAMGRSSFSSPPLVHAHAIVFMGWVVIYLLQNVFAATGRTALHRRLGWLAAAWVVPMLVLGFAVTIAIVRRGGVPFFFKPLQFLVFDPVSLLTFAGLTVAAILMRGQSDWHRRLHFCAMSVLLGPGFGRLLPMPLIAPWAWEATLAVCMIFPLVGMWSDKRRSGRVHPAWLWGLAAMIGCLLMTEAITYSPVGGAIYDAVVAGTPGEAVAPLAFAPPPGPPPAP